MSCSKGTFLKGTWKAWVENVGSFPAGDIVLSADKTADRGVTFQAGESPADMNNRTNDQNYRVSGTATTVSGVITEQDGIYFRIGLRSTCNQNQVRYARIAVEYGVGEQKVKAFIYLRQGQEADYVMPYQKRVTDAKKMTVYNLKSPTAYYYGYKNLAVNGAGFTDYPSQVGAYFQWANDKYMRYAFSNSLNPQLNLIIYLKSATKLDYISKVKK
ncbi:MAG: hypothetical protein EOM31_09880 [Bacteroidia bacterium]|nr:hypothetical protein [Bacteroidia bacterium]